MKTAQVTVEETHYTGSVTSAYPYNVWIDGRWFHLDVGPNAVNIGDEITVKYHCHTRFAFIDTKPAPSELSKEEQTAEKIYQHLFSQKFADWYSGGGNFDLHLRGDFKPGTTVIPDKEKVMEYIKKHFLV